MEKQVKELLRQQEEADQRGAEEGKTEEGPPLVDRAKRYEDDYFEGKMLVADSNYSSPANLSQCKEEGLDVYIPDIRFRTREPRFATQDRWKSRRTKRFILEDFQCRKDH